MIGSPTAPVSEPGCKVRRLQWRGAPPPYPPTHLLRAGRGWGVSVIAVKGARKEFWVEQVPRTQSRESQVVPREGRQARWRGGGGPGCKPEVPQRNNQKDSRGLDTRTNTRNARVCQRERKKHKRIFITSRNTAQDQPDCEAQDRKGRRWGQPLSRLRPPTIFLEGVPDGPRPAHLQGALLWGPLC